MLYGVLVLSCVRELFTTLEHESYVIEKKIPMRRAAKNERVRGKGKRKTNSISYNKKNTQINKN